MVFWSEKGVCDSELPRIKKFQLDEERVNQPPAGTSMER
jgi:hypothetical protein